MYHKPLPKLLLASQSPRRKQILESLNLAFSIMEPEGEEADALVHNIDEVTRANSLQKAMSVIAKISEPSVVVIGSDTLVVLEDVVMGKPKNKQDAIQMLGKLSGRWHTVVTGLALVSPQFGQRQTHDISRIKFKNLSEQEIVSYAETREPHDKAGSYAVQGLGSLFIEKMEGSYTNVMGFPLEKFLEELSLLTNISVYDWFS